MISITLALTVGCRSTVIPPDNIVIQETNPRESFVLDVGFESLQNPMWPTTAICVTLDVERLWEPGVEAGALNIHLSSNTELTVNETTLDDVVSFSLLSLNHVIAEDGEYQGSFSDLKLCFGTDQLTAGSYLAVLRTDSISGRVYTYEFYVLVE